MERDLQPNIESFSKIRMNCIFCHAPMRTILTNFIGTRGGIPFLQSPIKDKKILFNIDRVTGSNIVKASGQIDVISNEMTIDPFSRDDISEQDEKYHLLRHTSEYAALQAFEEQSPHIEIYCANKKCKYQYNLDGDPIKSVRNHNKGNWYIKPFLLFQETFVVNNLWVQNDWIHNHTNIFSINSIANSAPIKNPLFDFKSMDKDKLINRVKTLVTFS